MPCNCAWLFCTYGILWFKCIPINELKDSHLSVYIFTLCWFDGSYELVIAVDCRISVVVQCDLWLSLSHVKKLQKLNWGYYFIELICLKTDLLVTSESEHICKKASDDCVFSHLVACYKSRLVLFSLVVSLLSFHFSVGKTLGLVKDKKAEEESFK